MGRLANFENHLDRAVDGAAGAVFRGSLNPVQISKRAAKEMMRNKLVSAGRQYAPTLYNVLVSTDDDRKLAGMYPTIAGETETYLKGSADSAGLVMDGAPLVRFIVDDTLKKGRFDIIAENVASPIIENLRKEEMERYGLLGNGYQGGYQDAGYQDNGYQGAAYQGDGYQDGYQDNGYQGGYQDDGYQDDGYQGGAYQDAGHRDDAGYQDDGRQDGQGRGNREGYRGQTPEYEDDLEAIHSAGIGAARLASPQQVDSLQPISAPRVAGAAANAPAPRAGRADAGSARPVADDAPYVSVPNTTTFTDTCTLVDRKTGQIYRLSGARMNVGRERNNDIVIRDSNISRNHAELSCSGNVWTIIDLGSTNGTRVNGKDIQSSPLYDGDVITLGVTELEFREG